MPIELPHEEFFNHLCLSQKPTLPFLARCCLVSRSWRESVRKALPTICAKNFRSLVLVVGADGLCSMMREQGSQSNLIWENTVDMRQKTQLISQQCWGITCMEVEKILDLIGFSSFVFDFTKIMLDAGADTSKIMQPELDDEVNTAEIKQLQLDATELLNTLLLAECGAGHFKLAKMLLDAGADASTSNNHGNTALLSAITTGDIELVKMLIGHGKTAGAVTVASAASVTVASAASRTDGANLLSLAIVSANNDAINFAFMYGPRRLVGQGRPDTVISVDEGVYPEKLAHAFFDPAKIGGWIRGGATPIELMGELGALLSSAILSQATKNQLDNVRAFMNHHCAVLTDWSKWPVLHFVEQLAAQEPDSTFQQQIQHQFIIEWVNKGQDLRPCRWTVRGGGEATATAVSLDGSSLARVEGCDVMVYDTRTGFVKSMFRGDRPLGCVAFSPDGKTIAVAQSQTDADLFSNIWIIDAQNCKVKQSIGRFIKDTDDDDESQPSCSYAKISTSIFPEYGWTIFSMAFSPDCKLMVIAEENDCDVRIRFINAQTLRVDGWMLTREHGDDDDSALFSPAWCFSPDGSKLACRLAIEEYADNDDGRTVHIFGCETNVLDCSFPGHSQENIVCTCKKPPIKDRDCPVKVHASSIKSIAWSPCGKMLVSGDNNGVVYIWDAEKGVVKYDAPMHGDTCVTFSKDSSIVATGSSNGSLCLFDTVTGEVKSTLTCERYYLVFFIDIMDTRK